MSQLTSPLIIIAQPKSSFRERYRSETDRGRHRVQRFIRAISSDDQNYEYPTVEVGEAVIVAICRLCSFRFHANGETSLSTSVWHQWRCAMTKSLTTASILIRSTHQKRMSSKTEKEISFCSLCLIPSWVRVERGQRKGLEMICHNVLAFVTSTLAFASLVRNWFNWSWRTVFRCFCWIQVGDCERRSSSFYDLLDWRQEGWSIDDGCPVLDWSIPIEQVSTGVLNYQISSEWTCATHLRGDIGLLDRYGRQNMSSAVSRPECSVCSTQRALARGRGGFASHSSIGSSKEWVSLSLAIDWCHIWLFSLAVALWTSVAALDHSRGGLMCRFEDSGVPNSSLSKSCRR